MSTIRRLTTATLLAGAAIAAPAAAVQHVVTLSGTEPMTVPNPNTAPGQPPFIAGPGEGSADERYEFAGDFLVSHYGVAPVGNPNNANARPTALPPLERIVVESRTPGSGRTRGFHIPVAATGIAVADGGTGVFSALTNAGSKARDSGQVPQNTTLATEVQRAWVSNAAIGFTLSRVGNTITYSTVNGTAGQPDDVWSRTAASMAEINALQFRIRSVGTNTGSIRDVMLTNGGTTQSLGCNLPATVCGVGLTGAFSATAGDTHITLFDGITGDFSVTGNWVFNFAGGRSTNNAQIKLLSVPVLTTGPIPEPASWAMLIAGFGLTGAAMRRRRVVAA